MKTFFRLSAIALVAMSLTVACKSKPAEEPVDTMMEIIDTMDTIEEVAEEVAVDEPVKTVTAKKDEGNMKVADSKEAAAAAANKTIGARQKRNATAPDVKAVEESKSSTVNAAENQKRADNVANKTIGERKAR